MTIPGVGPVTSNAFTSTIGVPARFSNSRAVGPALGLTAVLYDAARWPTNKPPGSVAYHDRLRSPVRVFFLPETAIAPP